MAGYKDCWVCKDTGRILDPLTKRGTIVCTAGCEAGRRQRAQTRAADREALAAARADARYDLESAAAEAREDDLRRGA